MIYEERTIPGGKAILAILIAFLVLYAPWKLGSRELYWDECDYASMAAEMNHFPPLTVIHGELIPRSFPFYPVLVSGINRLGFSMEFSLRFVSVVSLLALTLLVWEAGRRAVDVRTGTVAAAMMASSLIVLEKAMDGYPDFVGLFFLTSAHLAWFSLGAGRGNWNLAWVAGLFLCGVAFYAIGWPAIVYFVVPLLFMRRPISVWRRLRKPGFFIGLAAFLMIVLFWGLPRWRAGLDIPFKEPIPVGSDFRAYFRQIWTFPFEFAWRFLPWTIMAWTPFCVAFQPLDRNPIFSRFLRTIAISLFFLLWFSPFTGSRDFIILVPSLSILSGIQYWLLVRRYGHTLQRILDWAVVALGIGAACGFISFLIPLKWWEPIGLLSRFQPIYENYWLQGFLFMLAALVLAAAAYSARPERITVWGKILCVCCILAMFFWGLIHPLKENQKHDSDSKQRFGQTLREAIGADLTPETIVYKDKNIYGLYGGFFYIGCKVKKIKTLADIPENAENVYLISMEFPIWPKRLWTELVKMDYKENQVKLYRGTPVRDTGPDKSAPPPVVP